MVLRGLGSPATAPADGWFRTAAAGAATVAVLSPAWIQLGEHASLNSEAVAQQRTADATQGAQLDRLLATVRRDGGGRVYAGMPNNWGSTFTVGQVPVFKYLERRDIDEVGYTIRTASLMTDPEFYFNEANRSDYRLFGVRYLILPAGQKPPVAAQRLQTEGRYTLWTLANGYVQLGQIAGTLRADRTNVGLRSIPLLDSALAQDNRYLRVAWGSGAASTLPRLPRRPGSPGQVASERADLEQGRVTATVDLGQAGLVVLSASYDPGWSATIDGRPARTLMVAPALVATQTPAGVHTVTFRYAGDGDYPLLFALSALALLLAALSGRVPASRSRSQRLRSRPPP
jgi:hypothetical protein